MAEQRVDAYGGTIVSGRTALRIWHGRIPHHRVKPGVELDYTVGVRSVDSFPMGARRIGVIPSN